MPSPFPRLAAFGLAVLGIGAMSCARASAETAPVVVELFTSQGCSSCPPADAFLTDLARERPDVLPLAFHVRYWNSLGWNDPFGLDEAAARQEAYARAFGDTQVYTPEMVVDGRQSMVGSDRPTVLDAIARAAADRGPPVPLRLAQDGQGLLITVGSGQGRAQVVLLGYDPHHLTAVGRGENSGRTLLESNIVRSMTVAGDWRGGAVQFRQPVPAGQRFAVLLQQDNGRILGAAVAPGPAS